VLPPVTITFGDTLEIVQGEAPAAWQHEDLSRNLLVDFPVISTNHAPPQLIGADGKTYPMKHGLVDLTLDLPDGPLRVCVLRLKNRDYHRANPAELRRSEARKWASVLKPPANSGIDFLLFVEAFAEQESAPVKALTDALPVTVLPVADEAGGTWTHNEGKDSSQHRWSFALANAGAAKRVRASRVVQADRSSDSAAAAEATARKRSLQLEFAP